MAKRKKDLQLISIFKERFIIVTSSYTYQEISNSLGVSKQMVGNYINGSSFPDYDMIIKIANTYNCSVDYLLGRTDIQSPDPNLQIASNFLRLPQYVLEELKSTIDAILDSNNAERDIHLEYDVLARLLSDESFIFRSIDYYRRSIALDDVQLINNAIANCVPDRSRITSAYVGSQGRGIDTEKNFNDFEGSNIYMAFAEKIKSSLHLLKQEERERIINATSLEELASIVNGIYSAYLTRPMSYLLHLTDEFQSMIYDVEENTKLGLNDPLIHINESPESYNRILEKIYSEKGNDDEQ